jgi:dienelactone hydrolase
MRALLAACGAWLAALGAAAAAPAAEIIEQTLEVPIRLPGPEATRVARPIAVTIVRESAAGRRPFLVLHHGRPADPAAFPTLGLVRYPANARYFASQGFVVLVPTRVGYGVSGGPDVEYTGSCASKRFADGVAPAVSETRQLLEFAAQLAYLDASRGLVVGESYGGLIAIAVAASDLPGVVGAVNIAGGDGGDPVRRVDAPCRPDQLRETLAGYGRSNRLPTLWMYSANDRTWGPLYPGQWFAAFVQAGGRGQFVALPADKNNGHFVFNRNPPLWQPAFERFIAQLGFAAAAR